MMAAYGIWTLGLVLLAAMVLALIPGFSARVSRVARSAPGTSLLLGLVTLIVVPVAAMIAAAAMVGLPIAVLLLFLYPALLVVGYILAAIALADAGLQRWALERTGRTGARMLAVAVPILALSLVALVPLLGPLIVLAAMLWGVGALLLGLRDVRGGPTLQETAIS